MMKLTNGNNNQEMIYQTTELLFYFKNKIQDTQIKQVSKYAFVIALHTRSAAIQFQ